MKRQPRKKQTAVLKRNIKLVLEYYGADFFGFQRQDPKPTVQKTLEEAFEKLFQKKIKIKSASGRTDSGVHAEGQVVNFFVESSIPSSNILRGLNRYLPPSLAVISAEDVPAGFHARYDAKSKIYEYQIYNRPVRSPLSAGRSYHVPYPLDVANMRRAADFLTGRHNFKAFCSSDPERYEKAKKGYVRNVKRIELRCEGGLIRILFEADGFLYHMVRNMVGLLIACGGGKVTPEAVKEILQRRQRVPLTAKVPASGLCLIGVTY